jgi:DnaJ-class molecular chaperone
MSNEKKKEFGEWQLCPKCNGEGETFQQRGTPGLTAFTVGFYTCPVCNGAKVLARPLIGTLQVDNKTTKK